ncbi:MAG: DUF2974 domain-containing protein [Clostridia bacterium]|nr:DUF2974 domain-containing protein [Clostridia bacterium]
MPLLNRRAGDIDNVFTYLKWRGDLSFFEAAFNEGDSLILSLISYVEFDGIVPGVNSEESITIKEASERFLSVYKDADSLTLTSFMSKTIILLKEAAKTKRFGEIRIGKYVNQIDTRKDKQFSASTFRLDDDNIYVAYRGTDATMVGWKEDFNMSFLPEIPAQSEAVQYLEKAAGQNHSYIRLGGHSKGGNLAIYSGVRCSGEIRKRILSIHNFDGPGFTKDLLLCKEYREMLPRISNYLPQASIIGMLLEHAGERKIVRSNHFGGILQHDAFSWEVGPTGFSYLKELDKSSLLMEGIIKEWINKLDMQQREYFVDILFGVLADIGIEKVTDFPKISNARLRAFVKSIGSLPVETREVLAKTIKLFFDETRKAVRKEIQERLRPLGTEPKNDGN